MKHLWRLPVIGASAVVLLLLGSAGPVAARDDHPSPRPPLTPAQRIEVDRRLNEYHQRRDTLNKIIPGGLTREQDNKLRRQEGIPKRLSFEEVARRQNPNITHEELQEVRHQAKVYRTIAPSINKDPNLTEGQKEKRILRLERGLDLPERHTLLRRTEDRVRRNFNPPPPPPQAITR